MGRGAAEKAPADLTVAGVGIQAAPAFVHAPLVFRSSAARQDWRPAAQPHCAQGAGAQTRGMLAN